MNEIMDKIKLTKYAISELFCIIFCFVGGANWDYAVESRFHFRYPELYSDISTAILEIWWINGVLGVGFYLIFRVVLNTSAAAILTLIILYSSALISEQKMRVLGMPLLPWDLGFISNATSLIDFTGRWGLNAELVISFVVAAGIIYAARSKIFRKKNHVRAFVLAASSTGFIIINVIYPPTPRFFSGQIKNLVWDLGASYSNNGPYYTFLVNVRFLWFQFSDSNAILKAEKIKSMDKEYPRIAIKNRPNVVVIISEAFTDLPTRIFKRPFNCLTPESRGEAITPSWGGLTANVEAELLTGYPQAIFPDGAVPFLMYYRKPIPHALPFIFARSGYAVSGIHTYKKDFFSRPKAYAALGLNEFYGLEDLGEVPMRGRYADDNFLFGRILDKLRSAEDQPKFIHAVTMMAHFPFNYSGRYPIREELRSSIPLSLKEYELPLLQYSSMIFDHEEMFCNFVSELSSLERNTIVLFLGDHYPSFESTEIYKRINSEINPDTPFNILEDFSRTPVAIFDSTSGFIGLAKETPIYNLGAALLSHAEIELNGLWAMEHKLKNKRLKNLNSIVNRGAVGEISVIRNGENLELGVLAAHAYLSIHGKN